MVVMDDELNINVYQNIKNIEETYMKKNNLMNNKELESPGKKSGLLKLPTGRQVTRQDSSLENIQFWKIVSNTIQLKQDPEQILEPHTIIAIEKY